MFYKEVFGVARGENRGKRIGVMKSPPVLSLHEWGNRLEAYPLMEYPVKEEMEAFWISF